MKLKQKNSSSHSAKTTEILKFESRSDSMCLSSVESSRAVEERAIRRSKWALHHVQFLAAHYKIGVSTTLLFRTKSTII